MRQLHSGPALVQGIRPPHNLVEMKRPGVAPLNVERNVLRVLGLSHRGHVFEDGRVVFDGPRENLPAGGHIERSYPGR